MPRQRRDFSAIAAIRLTFDRQGDAPDLVIGEIGTVMLSAPGATPAEPEAVLLLGAGLLRTDEPNLAWEVRSNAFGEGYLLHLAVDPGNPQRLFAITGEGAVMASTDGGATWRAVGG